MNFEHDCQNCKPLGEYEGFDLYYCPEQILGGSVLARYGNEAHEYASMPLEMFFYTDLKATHSGGLNEAARRIFADILEFDFPACLVPVRQLWEDVRSHPELTTTLLVKFHTQPEVDALLEAAKTETDPRKQTKILYGICSKLRMYREDVRYELHLNVNDKSVTIHSDEVVPLEERQT